MYAQLVPRGAACPQVSSKGLITLVSGVGAKGTSTIQLGGGRGLGPKGATRLADTLQATKPTLLSYLDLRKPYYLRLWREIANPVQSAENLCQLSYLEIFVDSRYFIYTPIEM